MYQSDAPVAIDLFAGAGGLGEGLAAAGIDVAVAQELHPQPALTYAFNHPRTTVVTGDIRNIDLNLLASLVRTRRSPGDVDVVVGGPPCQGFSTAGKKLEHDPRNDLFLQFARVIEHFRPRMFLMENVPGFQRMYRGAAYQEAVEVFSDLGYSSLDRIISAPEFGIPQRRDRFVMVGWRGDLCEPFRWPEPTHAQPDSQGRLPGFGLEPYITAREALSDLAFLEPGYESHTHEMEPENVFQVARRKGSDMLFNHLATRHREKAVRMFTHIPQGGTINSVPEEFRSAKRTMARLHPDRISGTVVALPDDLIHYKFDRIHTVREMARLQTFDDSYVFLGKRTTCFVQRRVDVPQYTQVGNAVPPLLGKVLGNALLRALGGATVDLRDVEERQRRHSWLRGSSAYVGYGLEPSVNGELALVNERGEQLPLPLAAEETPTLAIEPTVREWKRAARTSRPDWAPLPATP